MSGRPLLGPGLRRGSAALGMFLLAAPVLADSTLPPAPLANVQLKDPAKEAQAQALMATLRCVVCQGQSIADSDAEMAGDMRSLVRTRIAGGQSPAQIRDWLIARYGDYISYDPPFSALTAPLWITPLVLLAFGAWLARASFKRRGRR
jgi:cytochrome c-type biogenesis protein CcmH